jgi:hypothetical protein
VKTLLAAAICAVSSIGIVASFDAAPALPGRRVAPHLQPNPFATKAPVRNDTMHLTVLSSVNDTVAAPGKKLSVSFDITPKRGMHVYAPGKHDYQVIAVKVDPQPWLRVEPTKYPPSEIYHMVALNEKVETYGKPFTLVQDVTVLDSAAAKKALAAGTVKLSGRLEYQACDDKVCYAPQRIPVSFALTVK